MRYKTERVEGSKAPIPRRGRMMVDPAQKKAELEKADRRAKQLAPLIRQLRAEGFKRRADIAAALEARQIPSPSGGTKWGDFAVQRLLQRIAAFSPWVPRLRRRGAP